MQNNFLATIYSLPETVFTISDLSMRFKNFSYKSIKGKLYYFVKTKKLLHLRKGIYAKLQFNFKEFANKACSPSYISLESVLNTGGVNFQYYETIFLAAATAKEIVVNGQTIVYRRVPKVAISDSTGIISKDGYFIATLERAFLDAIYVYKNYHFDNLSILNWDEVFNILPIYQSKVLAKRVAKYHKLFLDDYA